MFPRVVHKVAQDKDPSCRGPTVHGLVSMLRKSKLQALMKGFAFTQTNMFQMTLYMRAFYSTEKPKLLNVIDTLAPF